MSSNDRGWLQIRERQAELRRDTGNRDVLTPDESLQVIAAELHRMNDLKEHEIALQERHLDMIAESMKQLPRPDEGAMGSMTRALDTLAELAIRDAARPAISDSRPNTRPAAEPVTSERGGTKITHVPPDEE